MSGKSMAVDLDHVKSFMGFSTAFIYTYGFPGIPTTIKTKGVNITTIVSLRVLIIQTGSTIILMVVEAQGFWIIRLSFVWV